MTVQRRSKPQDRGNNPLDRRAKLIADKLYERAKKLADALAPERPTDTEELPEDVTWRILEDAATALSPAFWGEPDALHDLYRLRKQFTGVEDPLLQIYERRARAALRGVPDPSITPESPEWEKQRRRMKRGA